MPPWQPLGWLTPLMLQKGPAASSREQSARTARVRAAARPGPALRAGRAPAKRLAAGHRGEEQERAAARALKEAAPVERAGQFLAGEARHLIESRRALGVGSSREGSVMFLDLS